MRGRTNAAPRDGAKPRAEGPGTLYLVPTPIGNLEDVTLRALRVLRDADLIACEDTRRTARLLAHFGISTRTESFHEHNEAERTPLLIDRLLRGESVALVSDAGTPILSDPGFLLVRSSREKGIPVVPLAGASAPVLALAGSGLPADSFFFGGFPPSRRTQRRRRLREWAALDTTLVLFEAPHRLVASLEDLTEILGPRPACIAREITKVHEEWIRGSLPEILEEMRSRDRVRGEITIVVGRGERRPEAVANLPESIEAHLAAVMKTAGCSRKEALKAVARERGISRREAYARLLREREQGTDGEDQP